VIRVEFFGEEIDRITEVDSLTGEITGVCSHVAIFPASHYATTKAKMQRAIASIEQELEERVRELKSRENSLKPRGLNSGQGMTLK